MCCCHLPDECSVHQGQARSPEQLQQEAHAQRKEK
jgi:hypothetical protein